MDNKKPKIEQTTFAFANGKFETVDTAKLAEYKKINPNDWWLAQDNLAEHKYGIAIQCIARREELYFKEWIEHHLSIGIERIFIYDNNDPGKQGELKRFLQSVLSQADFAKIEIIPWHEPMEFQQFEALKHCVKQNCDAVKWLLSIDLDEFFVVEKPMKELLAEFDGASQVYFSWESFGADGQAKYENKPVMERFKKTFACTEKMQGKSMFRPERMRNWNVHCANLYQGKTVNVLHRQIDPPDSFANIYEKAWVKHYFTKSLEEWVQKMKRGCADNYWCRRYKQFFEINPELESYFDPSAIQIQPHGNAPVGEMRMA